jgi:hypothetical protein
MSKTHKPINFNDYATEFTNRVLSSANETQKDSERLNPVIFASRKLLVGTDTKNRDRLNFDDAIFVVMQTLCWLAHNINADVKQCDDRECDATRLAAICSAIAVAAGVSAANGKAVFYNNAELH